MHISFSHTVFLCVSFGFECGKEETKCKSKGNIQKLHLTELKSVRASACMLSLSRVQLFATPWTVAHQAPLSMGFSRQEYWVGCHALLQGIFTITEVASPATPALPACSLSLSHQGSRKRTQ